MDDSTLKNRRRFLESLSVGGGILLAGCTDQLSLDGDGARDGQTDSQTTEQTGTESAGQGGSVQASGDAAAIAALDQQAMQQEQASIQQDVQNGDINQTEAQQQMAQLQQKYVSQAMESLTQTLSETEGVSVVDQYDSLGAVTVEGDASAILGVLESDDVSAFVSVSDLREQLEMQQSQQTQQAQG